MFHLTRVRVKPVACFTHVAVAPRRAVQGMVRDQSDLQRPHERTRRRDHTVWEWKPELSRLNRQTSVGWRQEKKNREAIL